MVVLVAGDYQPYVSDFQNICDGIGVTCLTYPAKRLKELQFAKKPVRCADGYHWSEQGHQIVAEIIQDTISNILHLHSLK